MFSGFLTKCIFFLYFVDHILLWVKLFIGMISKSSSKLKEIQSKRSPQSPFFPLILSIQITKYYTDVLHRARTIISIYLYFIIPSRWTENVDVNAGAVHYTMNRSVWRYFIFFIYWAHPWQPTRLLHTGA